MSLPFHHNPLTQLQSAQNYSTSLARNGVTLPYSGLTTGGQEQANYAHNLAQFNQVDPYQQNEALKNTFHGGNTGNPGWTAEALAGRNGPPSYAGMRSTKGRPIPGQPIAEQSRGAKVNLAPQSGAPFTPSYNNPGNPQPQGPQQPYANPNTQYNSNPYETPSGQFNTTARGPGGFGLDPNTANVATSIQPQQLFNPSDTAAMVAARAAQSMTDPNFLMKQFSRPGRSNDAGTLSLTFPQIANANSQTALAQQQIPFNDAMANSQFLLQGQQAQGQEGLALANLLRRVTGTNDFLDNQQLQALSGLLGV